MNSLSLRFTAQSEYSNSRNFATLLNELNKMLVKQCRQRYNCPFTNPEMLLFICFLSFSTVLSETASVPVTTVTPGNPRARCFLPKDSGDCVGNITHFYYSKQRQLCLKLFYTGCGGNANNFDELDDCITLCHEADMTVGTEEPTTVPSTIDPSTNPPIEPPMQGFKRHHSHSKLQ